MSKLGRNETCTCGSGKKFKKCCRDKPYQGPIQEFPRRSRRSAQMSLAAMIGLAAALNPEDRLSK